MTKYATIQCVYPLKPAELPIEIIVVGNEISRIITHVDDTPVEFLKSGEEGFTVTETGIVEKSYLLYLQRQINRLFN